MVSVMCVHQLEHLQSRMANELIMCMLTHHTCLKQSEVNSTLHKYSVCQFGSQGPRDPWVLGPLNIASLIWVATKAVWVELLETFHQLNNTVDSLWWQTTATIQDRTCGDWTSTNNECHIHAAPIHHLAWHCVVVSLGLYPRSNTQDYTTCIHTYMYMPRNTISIDYVYANRYLVQVQCMPIWVPRSLY